MIGENSSQKKFKIMPKRSDHCTGCSQGDAKRVVARKTPSAPLTVEDSELGNVSIYDRGKSIVGFEGYNRSIEMAITKYLSKDACENLSPCFEAYYRNMGAYISKGNRILARSNPNSNLSEKTQLMAGDGGGELRMALELIFGKEKEEENDTLLQLLEENKADETSAPFIYMDVNEMIKSKGNSVVGPKREELGRYNRKLFVIQSRENEKQCAITLRVNERFYGEGRGTRCYDSMVYFFKRGGLLKIDRMAILVDCADGRERRMTIRSDRMDLFVDLRKDDVRGKYLEAGNVAYFLHKETFVLYKIVILPPVADCSVLSEFFTRN